MPIIFLPRSNGATNTARKPARMMISFTPRISSASPLALVAYLEAD